MKQLKAAMNWIPVVAVLTIAVISFQHWQSSQAAKPDYDRSGPQPTALAPQPGQSEIGEVVKVSDGDTITVRVNGREDRIRFCGIDAPEVGHEGKPGQPLGEESREMLRSLISAAGNQVIISPAERDRYGRLVAEVFVSAGKGTEEEKLLNYELVKAGMAYHYAKYSDRCPNGGEILAEAEQEAKAKRLGVWGGNYQKPWDYRKAQR
jgi:endonuclease YncB( thermonuclease family)